MFFKNEEKQLAKRHSKSYLKDKYVKSEMRLNRACKTGKLGNIKKAMKTHHKYEYALLYKQYYSNKKIKNKEKRYYEI